MFWSMILKHAMFCKWVVEMRGSSQDLMAQLNFYGVGAILLGETRNFLTHVYPHM